ncbi:MAG: hypothetical protein KDA44_19000 [Planctomycetales bacterium]|nr:hypothetical protein [Planctomycetales bacterium]
MSCIKEWRRHGVGRVLCVHFLAALAVATVATQGARPVHGAVVVYDGFGDADKNNNGIPLEPADVDVSGAGDGTVGPYVALGNGGSPAVYPLDTMVNEVTAVENAADTGIRWYSIGGWTGSTPSETSDPRAAVSILSDAAGDLPETNTEIGFYHREAGVTKFAEAIDDGLALAFDSKGRGNAAAGFFNSRVELGPEVDDEVKVSFDFRIWYSAPGFNSNTNINQVPAIGDLRFGVYLDADNQLGQSNPKAGQLASSTVDDPAVWGQANGNFRGDAGASTLAGANGDPGWFVKLGIDDPDQSSFDQLDINRINEETNLGSASDMRILNGATDFVTKPEAADLLRFMEIDKVYNLSLSLKRFDDPNTPETTGDTIFATTTITEVTSGISWSFGNYEPVVNATTEIPDGISSDAWDYFVMGTGGSSSSDDFDWLIDNFTVEVFGSNAPANNADFNNDAIVNGADFLIWQRGLGLTDQTDKSNGNANADAVVDGQDLAVWASTFGTSPSAWAAAGSVPEPGAVLLIATACLALAAGRRGCRLL